jgi:hypothetical protein
MGLPQRNPATAWNGTLVINVHPAASDEDHLEGVRQRLSVGGIVVAEVVKQRVSKDHEE